jgi:5-methylcytosine-specific restriction endonuclease McrA
MKVDDKIWPNKTPDFLEFLGTRTKIPKAQWFEVMRIFTEKLLELDPSLLNRLAKNEVIRGTNRIWLSTKRESLQNPHKINDNLYFYGYTGAYDVGRYVDKLLKEFRIDDHNFKIICTDGSSLPPDHAYETITLKENLTSSRLIFENIRKNEEDSEKEIRKNSRVDIHERAKHAKKTAKSCEVTSTYFFRNPWVAADAKLRAEGICQLCNNKAPFNNSYGDPYLEAHHIVWLSKGGDDTIENSVALCPNCHKKMHVLNNKDDVKKLQNLLAK